MLNNGRLRVLRPSGLKPDHRVLRAVSPATRIAALYAIFATLWITLSDSLLGLLAPSQVLELGMTKGLAFVAGTTAMLWWASQRGFHQLTTANSRLERAEERAEGQRAILEMVARHQSLSDTRPDGIILDIQLPGMDGYQVARKLRDVPQLKNTPIIAVTSYAMVGDREQALAAGCTGYLEKPINPETFVSDVERWLSQDEQS